VYVGRFTSVAIGIALTLDKARKGSIHEGSLAPRVWSLSVPHGIVHPQYSPSFIDHHATQIPVVRINHLPISVVRVTRHAAFNMKNQAPILDLDLHW
jgi:hypothetical protein